MITANELRIRSKVNRRFWNPHPTNPGYELEICEVFSIQQASVHIILKDGKIIPRYLCSQLEPIPLTPEILEQCGFELKHGGQLPDYIQRDGFLMYWFENTLSANFGFVQRLDCEIKYLHQLQNLYFTLTDEELEIKF